MQQHKRLGKQNKKIPNRRNTTTIPKHTILRRLQKQHHLDTTRPTTLTPTKHHSKNHRPTNRNKIMRIHSRQRKHMEQHKLHKRKLHSNKHHNKPNRNNKTQSHKRHPHTTPNQHNKTIQLRKRFQHYKRNNHRSREWKYIFKC